MSACTKRHHCCQHVPPFVVACLSYSESHGIVSSSASSNSPEKKRKEITGHELYPLAVHTRRSSRIFWNMGVPLPSSDSAQTGFHCSPSQATAHGDAANSVADDVFSSTGVPHHVFVYGDLRPDAPGNSQLLSALPNQRAWLLGSRLYSINAEGNRRAAVKLEEYGHAVFGYALSSNNSMGISRILAECERAEHSPDSYERDVVEVITERGERLQSYIYHQPDVNPSHLVPSGDWLRQ